MQLPYWTWYRCKESDPTETGCGLCNTTNKSGGNKGDGDFKGEPILRYDHTAWAAVVFFKSGIHQNRQWTVEKSGS